MSKTISVHGMFSPCSAKIRASDKDLPVYSEKASKIFEIFTLLLSTVHTDKSKVKILQNFMGFSEYMNFTYVCSLLSNLLFIRKQNGLFKMDIFIHNF